MINKVALVTLLSVCSLSSVKAQNSSSNFSKQVALNFIDNISFTPEAVGNPLIHRAVSFNTTETIKPITEVVAPEVELNIENFTATQYKYAMMMDVEVEALANPTLYNFIEEWYGTTYRMGGTTKKGIDCSAFSGTLLSSIFSYSVPRTAREQFKVCERIDKENLSTGDLVFFNTRGGISHVGVYLTNDRFVHSSSTNGVTISNLNDSYYSKRFISAGRVNP